MRLRRWCYRTGLCKTYSPSAPVIVVGNISVGGTGKTPLVKALVAHLSNEGWQPGIISRGYGGTSITWPRAVATDDDPLEVGDEPLMLRQHCHVPVVVGPDRLASVQLLAEQYDCNIVVSDDGFQHLALERDLDIVVVDGEVEFGNGWCLPSGPLREAKSALQWADMIVVNSPKKVLRDEQFAMTIRNRELVKLGDPTIRKPLSDFKGQRIHGVAGLGNPERFFYALEQVGLEVVRHPFPDHHRFLPADFTFSHSEDILIMTEKDAVKCGTIGLQQNIWILPIQAELSAEFFHALHLKLNQSKQE